MVPGIPAVTPYEFDPDPSYIAPVRRDGSPAEPRDPALYEVETSSIRLDDGSELVTGGVRSHYHPQVLLALYPRVWRPWARWSAGVSKDLSPEAYARMSHAEVRAWQVLRAASQRASTARLAAQLGGDKGARDG